MIIHDYSKENDREQTFINSSSAHCHNFTFQSTRLFKKGLTMTSDIFPFEIIILRIVVTRMCLL